VLAATGYLRARAEHGNAGALLNGQAYAALRLGLLIFFLRVLWRGARRLSRERSDPPPVFTKLHFLIFTEV
jgi:hypothetical protein